MPTRGCVLTFLPSAAIANHTWPHADKANRSASFDRAVCGMISGVSEIFGERHRIKQHKRNAGSDDRVVNCKRLCNCWRTFFVEL